MAAIISRAGLDAARVAFFESLYRGKSVLCVGVGDGAALEVLLARGAAKVAGIDIDDEAIGAARARVGERAELKTAPVREAASLGAPFDVVLVRRGETMVARDLWREVSKLVRPGGWLVAAALAGDREGAARGAIGFAQLQGHLAAYFPHVTMLAQSAFAGAAVIPFGGAEVEPVLDVALAEAPVPELYVAVAGPESLTLPYGLIELPESSLLSASPPIAGIVAVTTPPAPAPIVAPPSAELAKLRASLATQEARARELESRAQQHEARAKELEGRAQQHEGRAKEQEARAQQQEARARDQEARAQQHEARAREQEARALKSETERRTLVEEMERRTGAGGSALGELRERLTQSEQALEVARAAALEHAEQMRAVELVLAERDAYVAELERDVRGADQVHEDARRSSARADEAETRERAARRQIAELQGTLLRIQGGAPAALVMTTPAAPEAPVVVESTPSAEHAARVAELSAQVSALQAQVAQLEAQVAQVAPLEAQVAELTAHNQKLQAKAADSERESWAHLKARSEAEAAAAEVREDTVRKLKDARKIANVELMRAMEEATRKAVMLKEELVRSERERKEAVAALAGVNEELGRAREELGGVEARVQRAASEQAARVLASLEARVIELEAERDRALAASAGQVQAGAAVVEVEDMLGDIGRALRTETTRVARIEESLVRALEDLRASEGRSVADGGPPEGGGGSFTSGSGV